MHGAGERRANLGSRLGEQIKPDVNSPPLISGREKRSGVQQARFVIPADSGAIAHRVEEIEESGAVAGKDLFEGVEDGAHLTSLPRLRLPRGGGVTCLHYTPVGNVSASVGSNAAVISSGRTAEVVSK